MNKCSRPDPKMKADSRESPRKMLKLHGAILIGSQREVGRAEGPPAPVSMRRRAGERRRGRIATRGSA